MNTIRPNDLAVVVHGLWPNVGRIVYVHEFVPEFDFTAMGLGVRPGWRVRSWSAGALETTAGHRMVGITPIGSLRRIDPPLPEQKREIEKEMSQADFKDALADLARHFEMQEALEEA